MTLHLTNHQAQILAACGLCHRPLDWRRGELGPDEAATFEAENAALERRRREIRGEGGR